MPPAFLCEECDSAQTDATRGGLSVLAVIGRVAVALERNRRETHGGWVE
jgi:hypothetical protein